MNYYETFLWAGVDSETAKAAALALENSSSAIVAVTGKIASGKDTVGQAVVNSCYPAKEQHHGFFAKALKDEVGEVITYLKLADKAGRGYSKDKKPLRSAMFFRSLVTEVSSLSSITIEQATYVLDELYPHVLSEEITSAYVRTPPIRNVLQYWGTNIRRGQDEDYWVKKSLRNLAPFITQGQVIWISDVRFPNEAEALRQLGSIIIRLDVSEQTQDVRLFARDGIKMSEESRLHPSETALDDYTQFSLRVNNEDKTLEEVVAEVKKFLNT